VWANHIYSQIINICDLTAPDFKLKSRYLLTPHSTVLAVFAATQEIPHIFYGTRSFFTVLTCPYPEPTLSSHRNPLQLPTLPIIFGQRGTKSINRNFCCSFSRIYWTLLLWYYINVDCNSTVHHINNRKYSNSYSINDECIQTIVCKGTAMLK
jgi:hypothetical protein